MDPFVHPENRPEPVADACGMPFPVYSPAEKWADGIVHALSLAGGLAALAALMILAGPDPSIGTQVALVVYGAGLMLVFCLSAAYHMTAPSPLKARLQRLDRAAIFVKIAGTYTPFALVSIGGLTGGFLLGAVWTIAAVGAPLMLLAPPHILERTVWLYLAQGWLIVIALHPLISALDGTALTFLVAGGLLYTVGVVFHLWERLKYHVAIWHGFVLTASACMFAAVLVGVAMKPMDAATLQPAIHEGPALSVTPATPEHAPLVAH